MKLTKEIYVHNRLSFEESEKDILNSAIKIISNIQKENTHSCGAEDDFLSHECDAILKGITELLNNYSNEYPDK